ncbi:MAG TPA: histidine kinase [Kofleriaceae bacterium]|nr:histidine kinase [Kofleriaceae bacterium]
MADSLRKDVAQTLLGSLGLGVVVGLLFSLREFEPVQAVVNIAISTLYSASIGVPTALAFRVLRPRMHGRSTLAQWLIYLGVVIAMTLLGSLFTGFVLVAAGVVPLDELWAVYRQGLKVSMLISIPFTFGAYSISRLQSRLERTERERTKAMTLATEARLASLESRVRPHFLFNALNSAIALIPEDPRRAEDVLERLCALLRFSLDAHARVVTLAQELRVVTDYLEIEGVRFGDRLRVEIDVPPELGTLEVPAFAIQTLVENSVKYAVAARTSGARIQVSARAAAGRLDIAVADDGPGFGDAIWLEGHGLDGLRARLDALHGDAAAIETTTAGGARVAIRLPARHVAEAA